MLQENKKKIKTVNVTFSRDVFWTMAWTFMSKIKWYNLYFCQLSVIFNILNY
jgi:hypothetical protein